jgi:hypothetical protein
MFAVIKFWRQHEDTLGSNSNGNISEVILRKAAHINYYYHCFKCIYFLGGGILVSPDLNQRSKRFSPALTE